MSFKKLLLAASLALVGCPAEDGGGEDGAGTGSSGGSGSGGAMCEPGLIEACLCTDGTPSTQVCLADGSGFSACDCVGMSGSGGGSDGSTGSEGGSATSGDGSSDDGAADSGSGGDSTGSMPECDGSHPLVEGDLRYCEMGNCYCGDFTVRPPFDVCYAMDIADACCPVDVVCY